MPDDALPQPWADRSGLVHYERAYVDVLGRPMRGTVRISGTQRAESADTVTVRGDVTVNLAAGRLIVDLPAGAYELDANLQSVDGFRVNEKSKAELT